MPSHVPRRSRRPGSRRLHAGHRLASQRAPARLIPGQKVTPGSDATYSVTTRQQRFACARLPGPHPTSFHGRLLRIAHHDTVTGPAACGGLKPPPVRRLRRAITFISCAARHSTRASPTRASGLPPSWRTFFQELASPPAAPRFSAPRPGDLGRFGGGFGVLGLGVLPPAPGRPRTPTVCGTRS